MLLLCYSNLQTSAHHWHGSDPYATNRNFQIGLYPESGIPADFSFVSDTYINRGADIAVCIFIIIQHWLG